MKNWFYADTSITLLLTLIFLSIGVTASEYSIVGTNNQFVQDRGLFNELMESDIAFAESLGTSILPPLVADLNNDSRKEIIILDNNAIVLYQNRSLDLIDSIFLNDTSALTRHYTNWITFDIDGDGMKEIIIAQTRTGILSIVGYNESVGLFLKNSYSLSGLASITISTNTDASQAMVACQESQKCALIYTGSQSHASASAPNLYGVAFNSTARSNVVTDLTGGTIPSSSWCFPHIRTYELQDFNANGLNDIGFNAMRYRSGAANELVRTMFIRINASNGVQLIQGTSVDVGNLFVPVNCDATISGTIVQDNVFSPPLVFDARPATPGLETIWAVVIDPDITPSFEIRAYDSTGVEMAQSPFPATLLGNIDGQLLSNVFRADALAEDGQRDFCVLGGTPRGSAGSGGLSEVNLLCGSMIHESLCPLDLTLCEHASFDGQVGYNVSVATGNWNILTHAAGHSQITTTTSSTGDFLDGDDLDEIVTSYGIFKLTYPTVSLAGGDNVLTLIYAQGKGDAIVYSLDMQNNGLADLLVQTATNIWYIDDGFTNTGARIGTLTTTPCLDAAILTNTTVSVTFSVENEQGSDDLEDDLTDLVNGRILAYVGETNQQDSNYSLTNSTGGTSFTKFFVANVTTGSSSLQIFGRDTGNPTAIDTITRSFTVSSSGLSTGTCSESFIIEGDDVETVFGTPLTPNENNTITQGISQLHELTGLGASVWWLIIMVIVGVGMLIYGSVEHLNPTMLSAIIMFIEALLIIIGAYIGVLGIGIVITIVIIAVAIIALLFLRPMLFGGSGGG